MVNWSKQFTLEFIELLRSLDSLWDMQHEDYHNSPSRKTGYNVLLQKVREIDPNATVEDIKRKLKCLRTNLKKMERRVLAYQKCGLSHRPSLFYYEPLSFLLTQDRKRASIISQTARKNAKRKTVDADNNDTIENTQEEQKVTMTVNEDGSLTFETSMTEEGNNDLYRDLEKSNTTLRAKKFAAKRIKKKPTMEDIMEAEVFGKYVATKLVTVSNLQRVYLEKIINDAIFEAELGNLTIHSKLFKDTNNETFYVPLNQTQDINEVVIEYVRSITEDSESGVVYEEIADQPLQENCSGEDDMDDYADHVKIECVEIDEDNNFNDEASENMVCLVPRMPSLENGPKLHNDLLKDNVTQRVVTLHEEAALQDGVSFDNVEFIDDSIAGQEDEEAITIIYVERSDAVENL